MDLFVVPTISFRLLYGLLIMGHGRRQVIWFGVTAHPTAEWIANQITEACGWEQLPRYLIRDRDGAYGEVFIRRLRSMGIRDQPTSPRSPWQNGYAERLIGSIRWECLDHVIVFGECHLRHLLLCYMKYYNGARTHLSLEKMHRSRAPSSAPGTFFVAQSWADCITNMPGFNLRQAQQAPQHHNAVCCPQRARRNRDRTQYAAPSSSGVYPLPQCDRGRSAGRQSRACDPRQLRRPQASQCASMAQSTRALHIPLHANVVFVAQRRRRLLRKTPPAAIEARCLRLE